MAKVIEMMNRNYYDSNKSYLAEILLETYKVSFSNGTYSKMTEIYEREIPSSKCFADGKHNDLDHVIKFCTTMKQNLSVITNDVVVEENENSFGRVM